MRVIWLLMAVIMAQSAPECSFMVIKKAGTLADWAKTIAKAKRRPVILRGFDWNSGGCKSLDACAKAHGDVQLEVTTGAQIARFGAEHALNNTWLADEEAPLGMRLADGPKSSTASGFVPWTLSLRDFVTVISNGTLPSEAYAFYEVGDTSLAAEFPALWAFFEGILSAQFPGLKRSPTLTDPTFFSERLAIGDKNSGNGWHQHGAAVLGLIEGKKQWFAAHMDAVPRWVWGSIHDSTATHKWLNDVNEILTERQLPWPRQVFSCTQEEGDIVYVPDQMAHAVLNERPSIAIGRQLAKDTAVYDSYLKRLSPEQYATWYESNHFGGKGHPEL